MANNLARVLPEGVHATLERSSWRPAPIFEVVQSVGNISTADIEATLNMGVGMAAVVPAQSADAAVEHVRGSGVDAWILGEVTASSEPGVTVVGSHRS